jgi:hypothetical protein
MIMLIEVSGRFGRSIWEDICVSAASTDRHLRAVRESTHNIINNLHPLNGHTVVHAVARRAHRRHIQPALLVPPQHLVVPPRAVAEDAADNGEVRRGHEVGRSGGYRHGEELGLGLGLMKRLMGVGENRDDGEW